MNRQQSKIGIPNGVKRFLIALQFLTILPITLKEGVKEKDFGGALIYFPFTGFLIGLSLAFCAEVLSFTPIPVRSILILIFSIIITGAIHLDGFSDTCDGFYGARSKEDILRIMRDSHVGAVGVAGIVCLLILKFALISSIPYGSLWKALIMMATLSRLSQVLACCTSTYARLEGKARYFIEYADRRALFIGALFSLFIFLALAKMRGLIFFVISLAVAFLVSGFLKRKLGGLTGDTIGALNEVSECVVLFCFII